MNILRLAVLPVLLLLVGCKFPTFGTSPPPTVAGSFSAFGESSYDSGGNCEINLSIPHNPSDAATEFKNLMTGQKQASFVSDNVRASQMIAAEANSDWLFFAGHGDAGLMQLFYCEEGGRPADMTSWGPGSIGQTLPSNPAGLPIQGLLKWIFTYSSGTVALPPDLVNDPILTANWTGAFGGKLHGLYGFYRFPGNCAVNADPGRICDIDIFGGVPFVDSFVSRALTGNPQSTIHQAWIDAAIETGFSGQWSMYENSENNNDHLGGDGANPAATGILLFYYAQSESALLVDPTVTPDNSTFTINPTALTPESLSDANLLSNAQPYVGSPDSYTNDGVISIATKGGSVVRHYLASGSLSFYGTPSTTAIAFSQATAQSAALQAAQSVNGLPADAALTETDQQWMVDPVSGGSTLIGYVFTWKHANAIASSDAIRVMVSDLQTSTQTCTGGYIILTNPPHQLCKGWTTTVSDTPNITYMFRMWHTSGAQRVVLSTGKTSITAATAAASLPTGAKIVAYSPGNWSPSFNDPNPNAATPAWVFTLAGGSRVYIDAYTGLILGSING